MIHEGSKIRSKNNHHNYDEKNRTANLRGLELQNVTCAISPTLMQRTIIKSRITIPITTTIKARIAKK